jgi:hypothetical protein
LFIRALFIRKTLASALTSLEKILAYNSRDKNLGKEVKIWKKKKPTHLPIIMYTNLRFYNGVL